MRSSFVTPKKSLGQHFLIDKNIARKIVSLLAPRQGETIVEIGPGNGALTELLITSDANIIAIDIDQRSIDRLHEHFKLMHEEKLRLVRADILETDLSQFEETNAVRIIGNIPYNITSPILFSLIEQRAHVRDAVVMMQREVAERICARPKTKEYGILSVFLQLHADVKIHFHVSKNVFHPKPNVESSVMRLQFREERVRAIEDYSFFKRVVRESFGKRRKIISNGLRHMDFPLDLIPSSALYFLSRRPEELSVDDFISLSNSLTKLSLHDSSAS